MVENNIIDKTVGNGSEAYKGGSRSCYEQVGNLDLLLFMIKKHLMEILINYILKASLSYLKIT